MTEITITKPQQQFIFSTAPHPALVAGYGAGKSQAAVLRIIKLALQYPGAPFAFVEPTFDLVRLIAWPRFSSILDDMRAKYELNKSESIMYLANGSQIIFRSADNPERMVGFEVADAVIDEIDTLRMDQAAEVWQKMLARCRFKKPDNAANTLAAASTPEGFKFVYQRWGKDVAPGYELIKAPTSSNPYLPTTYVEQLRATYNSQQLAAYLDGEFVNLNAGSVYPEFDRIANATNETIRHNEPLHIGIDFNVNNMNAVTFVQRNGDPYALDELSGLRDTPTMIQAIKERHKGHAIMVYPDASGRSRKSVDASQTDIALLKEAGFMVIVNPTNPGVKDRVQMLNRVICNRGERRLRVNGDKCPRLVESLERQAYSPNGEPDKSAGFDHLTEAAGYFIAKAYPINKPATIIRLGTAH